MSSFFPLLQPLLEGSNAVYFVYHLEAKQIIYVSAGYEQLTGDPAAHVNDDLPYWLKRLHPDDHEYLHYRFTHAATGEVVQDVTLRLTQPNGSTQFLSLTACRVAQPDGQSYLSGRLEDITRAKEMEINSQKFNTKKNATLEILSHDLATPLVLLQQLTDQLTQEVQGPLPASTQRLLELMERTSRQGLNLIRDFVDNEFLESANVELKWDRADLGVWMRTTVEEYQRAQPHLHLRITLAVPPQPLYVRMDINKFQQVINNLLSNALKFTPDGGQIAVQVEAHPGVARVVVADTGVGIPSELQPVLFEKFTKARRPGLRGEKSTGLGMSVIKTIVELHGGNIWLDSTEGNGATFTLEIPALPA
ncbi:PAS domain-containing sensor histidine kinase [Hymenobacter sp. BT18]|uniref:PAS domain-containing sensor histidine kinase n=1 Tax=Hymenobacter sp. BT18 TaxID=2835648 RepID=UPI00143E3456|nr:PAS domain-containing sensor histidine kinase [Hymenobacter sp. BT18]QIX62295.1 PAS domain-containing sensor histidine kinase [Hymenobacter sp. BT18]